MHWAVVLKGQKYYHLIEFGSDGVEYESLHDWAKNMMSDHSKVYSWKVKRLGKTTIFGIPMPIHSLTRMISNRLNIILMNCIHNNYLDVFYVKIIIYR
jgi:hypothetical protein